MRILVVDDNSPDGTAGVVERKRREYAGIHLLRGEKAGLGAAYIRGMSHALGELEADAVFEMDADFSHKPEDIVPLIAALEQGADFVIGSRYAPGGIIPEQWGTLRKLISRGGNLVARHIAGLHKIRDCTAGFRAIDARVLKKIDLGKIVVTGYAFQVALLSEAVDNGAAVKEIPVEFVDRTRGESKLGFRDIMEFVVNACRIALHRCGDFIRFSTVGASGLVVNLGSFSLLLALGTSKYLASPVAIELSILWNFFLNDRWTFRSRNLGGKTAKRGAKFNLVSLVALALSYSIFIALNRLFPDVRPHIHQLLSTLPAALVNYFLNSHWTFREVEGPASSSRGDTNERG